MGDDKDGNVFAPITQEQAYKLMRAARKQSSVGCSERQAANKKRKARAKNKMARRARQINRGRV